MSISVSVRTENIEMVGDVFLPYHAIVGWDLRDQYPMLGYTNIVGNLVLNELLVDTLEMELDSILSLCRRVGATEALEQLGAPYKPDYYSIWGWDSERDLEPLLLGLKSLCDVVRAGQHRYMWFIGD